MFEDYDVHQYRFLKISIQLIKGLGICAGLGAFLYVWYDAGLLGGLMGFVLVVFIAFVLAQLLEVQVHIAQATEALLRSAEDEQQRAEHQQTWGNQPPSTPS